MGAGQTGDHGGQYVLSVILAIIGVAFSAAPYFVAIGIVQGLMNGQKNVSFYLVRCFVMAVLWLGRVDCHALSTATSHKATFAVLGEIRKRCMEKLTRMPLGTVLEQSSGALKNRENALVKLGFPRWGAHRYANTRLGCMAIAKSRIMTRAVPKRILDLKGLLSLAGHYQLVHCY